MKTASFLKITALACFGQALFDGVRGGDVSSGGLEVEEHRLEARLYTPYTDGYQISWLWQDWSFKDGKRTLYYCRSRFPPPGAKNYKCDGPHDIGDQIALWHCSKAGSLLDSDLLADATSVS
ncbi:hypothetical protein FA10DRAFT_266260 [Acaromyces ingoldii]|uniref:Uncharacterized protein n=1 Tax=Acaromyces ingoldii TaxID=215250 RepID=A0A316YWS9_9BASI|nr:hypothetical protein FA10DRAFT_266260 [Acaromyces ingoldii]PWN92513.1 hypothetical protein FA10DRAFT_266260 [Acaromyces ingoldii]